MDTQTFTIFILIISGVLLPSIPALIVTVYVTRRNSNHITTLFDRIDEIKKDIHEVESEQKLIFQKFDSAIERLKEIMKELKEKT